VLNKIINSNELSPVELLKQRNLREFNGFPDDMKVTLASERLRRIIRPGLVQAGTNIVVCELDGSIVQSIIGEDCGGLVIEDIKDNTVLYRFNPVYDNGELAGYEIYGANREYLADKIIVYDERLTRLVVIQRAANS
jgi:hypothetical protein